MPVSGVAMWGKVWVNPGWTLAIPIKIHPGDHDLRIALWWPEAYGELHDDIDLRLIDPAGVEHAKSITGLSVFERVWAGGNLTPGTWVALIQGYNVKSGPQAVYWALDVGQ